MPGMERVCRLNSKAGLGSDGKEGMEVVVGLSDSTLNLDISTGQVPGKATAKMWLQVPSEAQRAGTASLHRPEPGGTWLVKKEGCGSRKELEPAGSDCKLHVTFYCVRSWGTMGHVTLAEVDARM